MAVEAFDGFDTYADVSAAPFSTAIGLQSKWYAPGGVSSLSLVTGRFGGQALEYAGQGVGLSKWVSRYFQAPLTDFAIGTAFRIDNVGNLALWGAGNGAAQFVFESNGYAQFGIMINRNGSISIVRQEPVFPSTFPLIPTPNPTILANSAAGIVRSNTWHYLGVEGTVDSSSGAAKVYLDGVAVPLLTITGVNTNAYTGASSVDGFAFVQPVTAGGSANMDIDDWAAFDTDTWEGEARVDVLRPVSDNSVDFTPSSGSDRYAMVDETLGDADTTYNTTNVVGDTDLFDMSNLSGTPTIMGAQLVAYAKKTDAATRLLRLLCDPGGGVDEGGDFALAMDYTRLERTLAVNPDTGVAWTAAEVNALLAGYKLEA